ncbi:hypothetical protein Ciccas_009700 [Cichlidogyrus casuarinus]|uniref:Uncharacterized protein n=1 Tax=Cichlidogyrus casuarinus TaxID=1844966 RepID=A0ABD2PW91_9PLAT
MSEGGLASVESIQASLDSDEYNHITATYFLLAERKLKRRHMEKFSQLALAQARLVQQTQCASPELEQEPVSTVDPTACQRRFSMILEDEEEEESVRELSNRSLRQSRLMLNRISSVITGPLPSMIEEEDQQLEANEEEEEEYETVARLAWFRSDIAKSSRTQSMSRYNPFDRSESSFHLNKLPSSLRSSICVPQRPHSKTMVPLQSLISVKSSPHLQVILIRSVSFHTQIQPIRTRLARIRE